MAGKIAYQAKQAVRGQAQQAKQAAVAQAKTQTFETLKSAKKQVTDTGVETPADGQQGQGGLVDEIIFGGTSAPPPDPEEIKKRDALLMKKLKEKLEDEMAAARGERGQATQAWQQEQGQKMAEPERPQEDLVIPTGKRSGRPQGAKGRMGQIQNKSEVGRGAKN